MAINFMSSNDNDEKCVMHSVSDNMEFIIYDNADEIIEELFESLLNIYQIGFETSMKGSNFIFDCLNLLYDKCHKINPNRSASYIDSRDWIKIKKPQ